jgi:hypothetical protein
MRSGSSPPRHPTARNPPLIDKDVSVYGFWSVCVHNAECPRAQRSRGEESDDGSIANIASLIRSTADSTS